MKTVYKVVNGKVESKEIIGRSIGWFRSEDFAWKDYIRLKEEKRLFEEKEEVFLKELYELLNEYDASISFEPDESADTQNFNGTMSLSFKEFSIDSDITNGSWTIGEED